ncbi:MAG: hypothetical protein H6831_10645 [Planctomycetes bacterium]|nr:hypothetical protein [Planctomycetota bacterium]MCB9904854.1 hypothetical protein [Planctomycetota bacterium]
MTTPRVRLAPGVPDWNSLGLPEPAEMLAGAEWPRGSEALEGADGVERARTPLPGTVHADGRRNGKPAGAGTGWLRVTRWTRPALGELLRARFTSPASVSMAERAWNLACALRSAGVSTAEPLAVVSDDRAVAARRSILVTRELEKWLPLPAWLERFDAPRDRRLLSRALGSLLGRLVASGVRPNALRFDDLSAHEKSGGRSDCAIERIRDLQDRAAVRGLELSALPELAIGEVRGGRIGPALDAQERLELVRELGHSLPAKLAPRATEVLRCLRGALGSSMDRAARHRAARELFATELVELRRDA